MKMIDSLSTTIDWQRHPGTVAVLPVGACEQHGASLPLSTDTIIAEFMGRMLAEALDAALLPALPIATSLEQSGFRGTVSLRPETAMAVIRDIADELERSRFTILVVANAHGGNHFLVPVVRDINRMDRPIKIIIANFYEYWDRSIASYAKLPPDKAPFHSEDMEASLMLAIAPDVVKDIHTDPGLIPDTGLLQRDLTTFGVGHLSRSGATGSNAEATAEKGRKLVESVRKAMIPAVIERIRILREQPRYSGAGGLSIRPMLHQDIPGGMRLKALSKWNQLEADWEMYLRQNPSGCFCMVHNGAVVGTVTSVNYADKVSWIGMVLVDPGYRRMGIATDLMQRAIGSLSSCACIKLDATPDGKKVYDRMGFADEYRLLRMACNSAPPTPKPADVIPMTEAMLAEVDAFDAPRFGVSRLSILKALFSNLPSAAFVAQDSSGMRGFCLGRRGSDFTMIGPVVADDALTAAELFKATLSGLAGRPVLVDVLEEQAETVSLLKSLGFSVQRPYIRMFCGDNSHPGKTGSIFAIAGPEIG